MVKVTQIIEIEPKQKQNELQQAALFQFEAEVEDSELPDITKTAPQPREISGREAAGIIPLYGGSEGATDKEKSEEELERNKKKSNSSKTSITTPVPEAEGYATYAFYRYRPQENSYREYQVSYQPSLWEPHAGQRVWGRRGNKKRLLDQRFETQEEALDWLRKMIQRRLKKGYVLAWYSLSSSSSSSSL
jgi:predicted DNA-binding WGR domain protein